jgi:hypothetical protein
MFGSINNVNKPKTGTAEKATLDWLNRKVEEPRKITVRGEKYVVVSMGKANCCLGGPINLKRDTKIVR